MICKVISPKGYIDMSDIPNNRHITYQLQYRKCGKPHCTICRDGKGHGPYRYGYWRDDTGRLHSEYVGKDTPIRENSSLPSPSGARTHWFGRQIALDVLRYRFEQGKEIIRIATGYFTVRGYNLLRIAARNKRMLILVGLDEPGEKRARKALLQEIMLDLRTGVDVERRQAVVELVARLKEGHFSIIDARALQHHAKLYIIDMAITVLASSNMTGRGLIESIEAGDVIENQKRVADFILDYDTYFNDPNCVNITQELIDELQKWLQMVRPWDVYLKTLDKVKSLSDVPLQRASYRQPVGYQNVVIANALRQIEKYRGAMIVASTGLGKTIMGVDIGLRLYRQGEILNVMVIGPKSTKKEWQDRLASAGLPCTFFIHQVLDAGTKQGWEDLPDLETKLSQMDERWLIIIDESHVFRNRYKRDVSGKIIGERRAFQRLVPAIQKSQCKVLPLTGSPYSTDIDNINNQLYLLPHTCPLNTLPGMEGHFGEYRPWHINKLEDLGDSPVASVITTPHVAKYYGIANGQEIIIDFHGSPRYIPHVFLHRVNVVPILEEEIVTALDQGYFLVDVPTWKWKIHFSIEREVRVAWGSSPAALREVIANVIEVGRKPYDVAFIYSLEERRRGLQPILDQIDALEYTEDTKLQWLCMELERLHTLGYKAIVFSERLETAAYLDRALDKLVPSLQKACTVSKTEAQQKRGPQQKTFRDIFQILGAFDPNITPLIENQKYDVLITTDANGIGVNLQIAQVVINYDLAWTAVQPTQRAGRVLRLYPSHRSVHLYTLSYKPSGNIEYGQAAQRLFQRTEKLRERHDQSTLLLVLPVMATQPEHDIHMSTLAQNVSVVTQEVPLEDIEKMKVSSIFEHIALLEPHKKEVQAIPDDIISAMCFSERKPLMYMLLQHNGRYYCLLYDIRRRRLLPPDMDISAILDQIACTKETQLASVDADEAEFWSDSCIQAWCRSKEIEPDQVTRICAMYLKPEKEDDTFGTWLNPIINPKSDVRQ